MRGKRSKSYRKLMQQYQLNFSFREPYQILLDSALIREASLTKMALGSRLSTTLHGEIKPMITQCSIRHLYTHAPHPDKDAWIATAKEAERRRCGHHELEEPLSEEECIMSVVDPKGSGGNRNRYVVATQDEGLRRRLRGVVGVPLVYVRRSVMILEPMSGRTEGVREEEARGKVRMGLVGRRGVLAGVGEKRKREDDVEERAEKKEDGGEKKKRKVKGPKGPNPLSAKKPKAKPVEEGERAAVKKAAKKDPQAIEKAGLVQPEGGEGDGQETKKRKRKRKPKDTTVGAETAVGDGDDA